ncbi:hypothetical protein BP5796_03958 [Coleophoma crateriformis]|uniref:D-xylose 1-dehydrogenase (NADP(+), D-xylono-1,5-lactone-forming) n=1 Tax=Coleophoma crateriformis TaxID=565419 RepID=A0A3D8SH57_9HELO|nr:hypothetical protein BP5796_03958 [Coleophoma crateriformis]
MASFLQLAHRNWQIAHPPQPAKTSNALRVGLLGASNIAPLAIIIPAKSHPEIIIAAVAARDAQKAQAYATKHGIPIVHMSYQELIDDSSIDIIYNPLPNGLHFEWALKALQAGKHVLLEKPSTSNAAEATRLFRHPILHKPNAPVLLEAFHSRFHPAWQTFMSLVDRPNITSVYCMATLFAGWLPNDDIRFKYDLSGGSLMDFGTYGILCMRDIMGTEPVECIEAVPRLMPEGFDQDCDSAFRGKFKFPNGALGEVDCDLMAKGRWPFPYLTSRLPYICLPRAVVTHKEVTISDPGLPQTQQHVVVKKVTLWNHMSPMLWHRIDIEETHTVREKGSGREVKRWDVTRHEKVYTWAESSLKKEGSKDAAHWSTYRYMLEEFVDRIRARQGKDAVWMQGEESIKQMKVIDSAYEKAGMKLRPSSTYR